MDEVLSGIQAKRIVSTANSIMSNCMHSIEKKSKDFSDHVSQKWEDKVAVAFFDELKRIMMTIVDTLDASNKRFAYRVEDIANQYCKIGGMTPITVEKITLTPFFDFSAVKDHFDDSENVDTFGFKNPATAPEEVLVAYDELETNLKAIMERAVEDIRAIHAFGNRYVQEAIADCVGRVVNIVRDHITNNKSMVREALDVAARSYTAVGEQSRNLMHNLYGDESGNEANSPMKPETPDAPPRRSESDYTGIGGRDNSVSL